MKLTLLLLAVTVSAQRPNISFDHHYSLGNANGEFNIDWLVQGSNLIIRLEAQALGWIGIGFSESGGMQNADMAIAWVDQNGNGQISGRIGPQNGNGYPDVNPNQYYRLISAVKNQTHLTAVFSRPLVSCTPNSFAITSDTTRLIWAYNRNTVPNGPNSIVKHDARGTKSVNILAPQTNSDFDQIVNDPSVSHFDVQFSNVHIPSDTDTYYHCQVFPMPNSSIQKYIIAADMIVDPKNVPFVHHTLMYGCNAAAAAQVGPGADCFSDSGIAMIKNCETSLGGWAMGGEPFVYPSNMAMEFFEPSMPFIMMQVHYNNPNRTSGIVDNSAYRYYLIDHPRAINAGSFLLHTQPSPILQVIPPMTKSFTTYVYCPAQCTSRFPQPMNVLSGLLHSHLIGRKLRLRQVRNGRELPPVVQDNNYDFNFQNSNVFSKFVTIMPGDDLILECTYDSSHRPNVTVGGWGTSQEMCSVFLQYFPKTSAMSDPSCTSFVDPNALLMAMGGPKGSLLSTNLVDDQIPQIRLANGANMSVVDYYNTQLKWTPQLKRKLQNFAEYSQQTVICSMTPESNQEPSAAQSNMMNVTGGIPIRFPYQPPNQCNRWNAFQG